MKYFYVIFIVCQIILLNSKQCASDEIQLPDHQFAKQPTILIVTLFRNKAFTMPHFLTYLNQLEYPKDRIILWWTNSSTAFHSNFLIVRSFTGFERIIMRIKQLRSFINGYTNGQINIIMLISNMIHRRSVEIRKLVFHIGQPNGIWM